MVGIPKFSSTIVEISAFAFLGSLGYLPKLKHTSFSCNFFVFHCVSPRILSYFSDNFFSSQVPRSTQVLKLITSGPYQCSSALLVLFFHLGQKCNTCKKLASLNAILARFLQESCTECIALQESCKEGTVLQDSCATFMFCNILARILQVKYYLSKRVVFENFSNCPKSCCFCTTKFEFKCFQIGFKKSILKFCDIFVISKNFLDQIIAQDSKMSGEFLKYIFSRIFVNGQIKKKNDR